MDEKAGLPPPPVEQPLLPPPPYESVQHIAPNYPVYPGGQPGVPYSAGYPDATTASYPGYPQAPIITQPGPGYPMPPSGMPQPGTGYPPQSTNTNVVIVSQPTQQFTIEGEVPHKPPNYLCFSIITCLCCNCLFGMIALFFSCQSNNEYQQRNYEKARKHGRMAFTINIVGICVSIVGGVFMYFLRSNLHYY